MSVCIAAVAEGGTSDPKLVLCADTRIEIGDFVGADTGFKIAAIGSKWMALMAGSLACAREAVDAYRASPPPTTSENNALDRLKSSNAELKRRKTEEHIRLKWGMSYDDFLLKGRQSIPEDLYHATWREIEALGFGCELIVAGFTAHHEACIFSCDNANGVNVCEHFAAIGSGAWIAQAALYQRGCERRMPVDEVLYYVYEAKRLSEIAPGVGKLSHLGVTGDSEKGLIPRLQPIHPKSPELRSLEKMYKGICLRSYVPGRISISVPIAQ